jgi:hypothetical protein
MSLSETIQKKREERLLAEAAGKTKNPDFSGAAETQPGAKPQSISVLA